MVIVILVYSDILHQRDINETNKLGRVFCTRTSSILLSLLFRVSGCGGGVGASYLLPFLPNQTIANHIDSDCSTINSCVQSSILDRSFAVKLLIDPCTFTLKISVDKLEFEANLYNFDYGR